MGPLHVRETFAPRRARRFRKGKQYWFSLCTFAPFVVNRVWHLFRRLEAVAGAADGFQVARVLRVGLDFFADTADVDVDRARSDVGGVAPDGVEQMIAGEDASLVARE